MSERIIGHTELIGLMACPIRHSNSPAMQNEAFAKLGYDYAYLAFKVGANEIGVGMKSLEGMSVIPDQSYFHPDLIVVDILYSPPETAMRSMAKKAGCKTMNGLV